MKKIDLARIIKDKELDKKELAKELFPKNIHQVPALKRVLDGDSVLDADQISKLSIISGLSIAEIFSGENWTKKLGKKTHTFTSGAYRAELDIESGVTRVYDGETLAHEEVLHKRTISLVQYLKDLDFIILNI